MDDVLLLFLLRFSLKLHTNCHPLDCHMVCTTVHYVHSSTRCGQYALDNVIVLASFLEGYIFTHHL